MVNFDHSSRPLPLDTNEKKSFTVDQVPSLESRRGTSAIQPFSILAVRKVRGDVTANGRVSEWTAGSCSLTRLGASGFRVSSQKAIEAVATQSNRSNRELSSATMWNSHVHHRLVRGHIR